MTRSGTASGSRRLIMLVLTVLALCALITLRVAAVSISPLAVYMDHKTRSGTITLYNPASTPEEIRIGFAFGYPQSDEDGNVSVSVVEQAPDGEPSAVEWLRAFPQRLVLPPGGRQVVRVMANPPADLPEGEYWARVLVHAKGGQAPIEQQEGDVGLRIDFETVVVGAVNYRNGDVGTGLDVRAAEASLAGDTVVASIEMERTGNAAYVGRLRVEAVDARGRVVASREEVLAVYRTMLRRLHLVAPEGAAVAAVRFVIDDRHDALPRGASLSTEETVVEVPVS